MVFMIITEFFLAILAILIFWTRIAVIENFIAAVKKEMSVKISNIIVIKSILV